MPAIQYEKKYALPCSLDCLAANLFNELNTKDDFNVTKIPTHGKYVFTVEKKMNAVVKLVACKYKIILSETPSGCKLEFENLDTEPVFLKYIKAYFITGIFKIISVNSELKEVNDFPEYIDLIMKKILKNI